ncbi:MAG: hypothetical protein AB1391_02450 [Candidatus Micrarchaeota archaeon]
MLTNYKYMLTNAINLFSFLFLFTLFLTLFLFTSVSSAIVCPTCSATHIGITEKDGEITAVLFEINKNIELNQDLKYFDNKVKDYLGGKWQNEPTPSDMAGVVSKDIKIDPIQDAELFFYYYDNTGRKKEIINCAPLKTEFAQPITYTDDSVSPPQIRVLNIPYATCTIPRDLYTHSSIAIYIEFKGDQTRKPSEREVTVYDVSAGGLNVLMRSLQNRNNFDPTSPICLGALIMIGLLFASMYFSGKSPLSYLDLTVPRVPRPKQFGFGPIIAGTGNIRIAMSASRDLKFLDKIIKYHSMADFRGLEKNIAAAINQSRRNGVPQSEVRKYIAKLLALRKEDWRRFLEKGDEKVMLRKLEKEGKLSPNLLMAMNQHIAAAKIVGEMGVVGGNAFPWVKKVVKYVRMVPLIGTFLSIGTASFSFTLRTMKDMARTAASYPLRKALGAKYEEMGEKEAELGAIGKTIYGIAKMTDTKKMEVGKLFPLHEYTKRFYEDTRDSCYDEITINVIWQEIVQQLKNKTTRTGESVESLLASIMDFKKIFTDRRFIEALQGIILPVELLHIFGDSSLSPQQQAEQALRYANARWGGPSGPGGQQRMSGFVENANELYNELNNINGNGRGNAYRDADSFTRANALVNFMRRKYAIDQPTDISDDILKGKFFITTGRDNLYYEQSGEKKNFGFLTLGLREFIQQLSFLASVKKPVESFTVADSFKLAWAKMMSQVFGNGNWYLEQGEDIMMYDPSLKKTRAKSFVKDILGMNDEELKDMNRTMKEYLYSLMSEEGQQKAEQVVKKSQSRQAQAAGIDAVEDFLYGYDIRDKKRAEETALNPLKRRSWYYLESESYPDEKYWKPNMNFLWSSIGAVDKRTVIAYLVRGEKYRANIPRPENAWSLMENYMDTRFANILNGSQWDFFGYAKKDQHFERFSRVDMQRSFNETWNFYTKINEALGSFYLDKTGKKSYSNKELEDFLSSEKNRIITYNDLKNGKTPFIYTYELNYVPYVRGMPVSDFDRIVNGVFVLQDENGKQKRTINSNELAVKYNPEMMQKYGEIFNDIQKLKKQPLLSDIEYFEQLLKKAKISVSRNEIALGLNILRQFSSAPFSSNIKESGRLADEGIRAAAVIRKIVSEHQMDNTEKFKLLRALDSIDPHMQTPRSLTRTEIDSIANMLINSKESAEIKLAFLKQFSAVTQDYQSIWTDPRIKFFSLVPERDVGPDQRNWFGRFLDRTGLYNVLRGVAQAIEVAGYSASKTEFAAMSSAVSSAELYRERGNEMRMRIKTPGYLESELSANNYKGTDLAKLVKAYDAYSDSTHRFFNAFVPGFTRDPRGGSTQWGRQWYLAPMYHRGLAMCPPSADAMSERSYLSPLGWFFSQPFHRTASLNWMLASLFVRPMRAFQTAAYGYPTVWDRNITPTGNFDALNPWQYVPHTGLQKARALLNPHESIFNIGQFKPAKTAARALQIIPGLNVLSYFFPQLEPENISGRGLGRALGSYGWYKALAKVPGFGAILGRSQLQLSQRAGQDILESVKQRPEDFSLYKGGAAFHYFTDSANPGVSYVDYSGRGRLAPRIGRFLTDDVSGGASWKQFYRGDEYVSRQATFSAARRGIAAEMKRLHLQDELTGYGPNQNPMWAPLSVPTLGLAMYNWFRKSAVPSVLTAGAGATAFGPAGALIGAPGILYHGYKDAQKRIKSAVAKRKEEEKIREAGGADSVTALRRHMEYMNKLYIKLSSNITVCLRCGRYGHKLAGGLCPYCKRP